MFWVSTIYLQQEINTLKKQHSMNNIDKLSDLDKVSIVALAKRIEATYSTHTIAELAVKFKVPLMTEFRHRQEVVGRLMLPPSPVAKPPANASNFAKELIALLMERSGAVRLNNERRSYAPWIKSFLVEAKDRHQLTHEELAAITGISIETLTGFPSAVSEPLILGRPMSPEEELVIEAWKTTPPWKKKTIESFWRNSKLPLAFNDLRQKLINLGFCVPRGPKLKNEGARVKRPFAPHAIWEGDAKFIKIYVNSDLFVFSWYAFVDQHTTLIVGSNVGATESPEEFLKALKNGRDSVKTFSVGILIDNRLDDAVDINNFCKEHNIVIVRIFPGSSKTNGYIENNFSIFEKFVGEVRINGTSKEQVAQSLAQAIVEIFTQQRNHAQRKRFGQSPGELAAPFVGQRPEHIRSTIEKLRDRFDKEHQLVEEKWAIIKKSRTHFGYMDDASEAKFKKIIATYPVADIVAAQASYLAQIAKYPEKRYPVEYFFGILRHKRETKLKNIYTEEFRAGIEIAASSSAEASLEIDEQAPKVVAELIEIEHEATPARRLMRLDALCWCLVALQAKISLTELWSRVGDLAAANLNISLRWWSEVMEYLFDRLGYFLLLKTERLLVPRLGSLCDTSKSNLAPDNLRPIAPL
jgi:hypothetical protein